MTEERRILGRRWTSWCYGFGLAFLIGGWAAIAGRLFLLGSFMGLVGSMMIVATAGWMWSRPRRRTP